MKYVAEHMSIQVPKIYATHTRDEVLAMGFLYVEMEYIEGSTWLPRGGKFSCPKTRRRPSSQISKTTSGNSASPRCAPKVWSAQLCRMPPSATASALVSLAHSVTIISTPSYLLVAMRPKE